MARGLTVRLEYLGNELGLWCLDCNLSTGALIWWTRGHGRRDHAAVDGVLHRLRRTQRERRVMATTARPVVVVTDTTTRAEVAETLALLCENAKRISRRGKVGTLSADYERAHGRIDAVLDELLAMA